jgi:predicted dinucleotide-binding enzyme
LKIKFRRLNNITIIGAGNMGRGIATRLLSGGHSVTLVGRDEAQAAELAQQLRPVQAGGLRPIDVGPLRRARQLEGIGLLHITLQRTLGTNWMSTIKILS